MDALSSILEVEDRRFINDRHPTEAAPPKAPSVHTKRSAKNVEPEPEASPHIDDHALFWSTYDKVTGDYDRELLDGWNKSLDILLIFAGLFSAINTAFIMDSYKSLQPDPVETTNNLLRLLITHRNDNITLSVTDLNPGYQNSSSAISINSIFFASLSFSLTAAFGAVTAKQWLTEYSNTGLVRALHHQGRERQAKFKGLETWHFRFIMDLLPALLQVSLLLFLIGLIELLWVIEWKVAAMQLVLSAAGIAVYLTTIIIGVAVPTSPFQTPLSKYISQFLTTTWRGIEAVGRMIKSCLSVAPLRRFYDVCYSALPESAIKSVIKGVEFYSHQSLWSSNISVFKPTVFKDSTEWDRTTKRAVDCVVWLLEHSEHLDTTIVALDACLRLPTELLLSTINQREGLRERLLGFHRSLLLRSLEQRANRKESLQELVAISDIALFHLFKLDQDTSLGVETRSYEYRDFGKIPISVELINPRNITTIWGNISVNGDKTALQPLRLQVDLSDARQTSVTNHLVSYVIPADLWIEAVTCDSIHDFKIDHYIPVSLLRFRPWSFIIETLQSILEAGPALSTISHVANAIAAFHWKVCPVAGGDRWGYSAEEDQHMFVQSLKNNVYALDKRQSMLTSVSLALSLFDKSCPDVLSVLYCRLLSLNIWEEYSYRASDQHFAQCLLQLERKHIDDEDRRRPICKVLSRCLHVGSFITENVEAITELLKRDLLSSHARHDLNDFASPLSLMIAAITKNVDDSTFHHIFFSEYGILSDPSALSAVEARYSAISPFRFRALHSTLLFPDYWLKLWSCQVVFVLDCLPLSPTFFEYYGSLHVVRYILHIVTEKASLLWPAYFPSESLQVLSARTPGDYLVVDSRVSTGIFQDTDLEKAWIGDSVLLLWRAARKFQQDGTLPAEWTDSAFFAPDIINLVLDHYHLVTAQGYIGVDHDTFRNYFEVALANQQVSRRVSFAPNEDRSGENQVPFSDIAEPSSPEKLSSEDTEDKTSKMAAGTTGGIGGMHEDGDVTNRCTRIAEALRSLGYTVENPHGIQVENSRVSAGVVSSHINAQTDTTITHP